MSIDVDIRRHDHLRRAICHSPPLSRQGLLEKLFAWSFKGLVYPQIWEDPEIDMEALAMTPDCHVVAIASGGCNILSYLVANPAQITAVDLNRAHVALSKLKLAAVARLPSWKAFYRFFGEADETENLNAYWRFLAPHLDGETRAYWEARSVFHMGPRRISLFSRNFYRHGLLGHFIGFSHAIARAYGVDPRDLLRTRSLAEQRNFFHSSIEPLFAKRFVRWLITQPWSLFGLGIPAAQYSALASCGEGMPDILRKRVEKLICGFALQDNYFTWQAFGRAYAGEGSGPLPPYLQFAHFDKIRSRASRVDVRNCSLVEYLESRPNQSLDRYILLDAQDWMTNAQLDLLWKEIMRTARCGARVIFRTAGRESVLPGRVSSDVLDRWRYEAAVSRELTERDRAAIYGGFHLYVLTGD